MRFTSKAAGNGTASAWHPDFLFMVPAIRRHAYAVFRDLDREDRDEAVAEVIALAMIDYLGHLERARPEQLDPAALALSAALHVRHSERACGRESACDVLSPTAQRRRGFKVEPLKRSCEVEQLRRRFDLRRAAREFEPKRPPGPRANGDGEDQDEGIAQERNRRRTADKRLDAFDIEFEAARRIQEKLMPAAAPALAGFDIAGITRPAKATGGDYFDYVPMLDGSVGVVVGDVSDHGFGPALLMASTRAYLRAFAQTQADLGELLSLVNRVLTLDMEDDRFVTLVLARLDPRSRTLVYTSAGHPTAYVLNASGHVRLSLPSTGPLLGAGSHGSFLTSPVVPLEPGELVILLSDGVLEASAPDGAPFGSTRAAHIVRIYRHDPAAGIVYNLYHAVRAFAQNAPQLDDITAVVIKVKEGSANELREPIASNARIKESGSENGRANRPPALQRLKGVRPC
jgi:serine phosphatase RsbU (regulator of sigma subunit)